MDTKEIGLSDIHESPGVIEVPHFLLPGPSSSISQYLFITAPLTSNIADAKNK